MATSKGKAAVAKQVSIILLVWSILSGGYLLRIDLDVLLKD